MNPMYPVNPLMPIPKHMEIIHIWELAEKIFIQSYSNKPYMKTNEMIKLSFQAANEFYTQKREAIDKVQKELMNYNNPVSPGQ